MSFDNALMKSMSLLISLYKKVTKLAELYKERSEEWSKKAGELEGVIKALEVRICLPSHASHTFTYIQFQSV